MMSPSRRPAVRAGPSASTRDHQHAARLRQVVEARHAAEERHILPRDAEVAAPHAAVAKQRGQDARARC